MQYAAYSQDVEGEEDERGNGNPVLFPPRTISCKGISYLSTCNEVIDRFTRVAVGAIHAAGR
jgi:hypothetical protein